MASKSTRKRHPGKPGKPHPDFPLFPHATGRWAKKVKGKFCYFGKTADDPHGEAALKNWLEQKDDLLAGRTPRVKADGLTVADLCNHFLTAKRHLTETGELSTRTFADYHAVAKQVVDNFGQNRLVIDLAADDFDRLRCQVARTRGPVGIGNVVQRTRTLFRYGHEAGLIDRPVRFGPTFKKPGRKVMRRERAKRGSKMLEAADIRRILDAAPMPLRAMVLLGVNSGFGNADIRELPLSALEFDKGWVNYPRPKTGIERRCPLWSKTVAALREAIARRPTPKSPEAEGLVFVTRCGGPWGSRPKLAAAGEKQKNTFHDPVAGEFRKVLVKLGIHRPGLGFYALRHVCETIGGDSHDQVATDHVMGHSRNDMASVYRERIDDARLLAVVEHVHKWLFGPLGTP
ncbi:MAG: tyrosine-type recombinase/integrase [Planctomycetes bacterium]|nr:tyrosine-type recombinase/integrase [Planctomycetota bacterium]MBU4400097.1 tyrosine-type recombinase/integrase [Planctomycetota bacterium]MCG2682236.1 tyrosine-type recombinase/integrase [Planctomycetales bacterium]